MKDKQENGKTPQNIVKKDIEPMPSVMKVDGERFSVETDTKFFMSNDILNGHFNLEITELKIIILLISAININDEYCKPFVFSYSKLSDLLSINRVNFMNQIAPIIEEFHHKTILIKSKDEQVHTRYNWMVKSEINYKNKTVSIALNPFLHKFFINFKKGKYKGFNYMYASRLTSKHTMRIYMLIVKNYNLYNKKLKTHMFYMSLEDLRIMLQLQDKYKVTSVLRASILDKALSDLTLSFNDGLIDYKFSYEPVKMGRKVIGFNFFPEYQELTPGKIIDLNKNSAEKDFLIHKHQFENLRTMFNTMNKKQAQDIILKLDENEKENILNELEITHKRKKEFLQDELIRYIQKKNGIETNHAEFEKFSRLMGYITYWKDNTNCAKRENNNE